MAPTRDRNTTLRPAGRSGLFALLAARATALALVFAGLAAAPLLAQVRGGGGFIRTDAPVIALTNARVIDGTGAPTRADQAILIRDGRIAWVGPAAGFSPPPGAEVLDLAGRTVTPGFVMVHEHMYYPAGNGVYNQLAHSFPRLYLAGGATTIRTGGSIQPYTDLNLKRRIDAGQMPGPKIHVTAPYLEGANTGFMVMKPLDGPDDARRMVEYWAGEGATSFKAYMNISRAELGAAVEVAHARGLHVTGHLCSVTYREAADLGIDNLEHGFLAATDFVTDKQPDRCPGGGNRALLDADPGGPEVQSLMRHLIDKGVAVTSTLTVFETFTPGRPRAPDAALDAMVADAREAYLRRYSRTAVDEQSIYRELFPRAMALEVAFFRAGGLLVAGTDPTGYGGVVAGFSNSRAIELLVEAGLSAEEAIRVGTLNGALLLGVEDEVGTIAVGQAADLVVVRGDPAARIADIANVEIVFKDGVGYDPARLRESVQGSVGIR